MEVISEVSDFISDGCQSSNTFSLYDYDRNLCLDSFGMPFVLYACSKNALYDVMAMGYLFFIPDCVEFFLVMFWV